MAANLIKMESLHYIDADIPTSSLTWIANGSLYTAEISTATSFGRNDICMVQVINWAYSPQWAEMDGAGSKVMIYSLGNQTGANSIKIRGFFGSASPKGGVRDGEWPESLKPGLLH